MGMIDQQGSSIPQTGLNLIDDPNGFEVGDLSFILNGAFDGHDQSNPMVGFYDGNEQADVFPPGYIPIGRRLIDEDIRIFMLANPQTKQSEIGRIYRGKYETIVNDAALGFDVDFPIELIHKYNFKGELIIYFVGDAYPIRSLNLNKLPMIDGKLDIDQLSVFKKYQQTDISIRGVISNGRLFSGMYYFCTEYADVKGNPLTAATRLSGGVPIYRDSIDGAYQTTTGSAFNTPTDKAIRLQLNNQDTSFQFININVIEIIGGVPKSYRIGTIPTSQKEFIYSGANTKTPVLLEQLLTPATVYESAGTIDEVDHCCTLGRLTTKKKINLQPYFLDVQIQWINYRMKADSNQSNYKNPLNTTHRKGFWADEVYQPGLILEFADGTESDTIVLPGRRLNQKSDKSNFTQQLDQYGSVINPLQWDSAIDVVHDDDKLDDTSIPRHQAYNTATIEGTFNADPLTEGYAEYGEMGYYESTDTYPNEPAIWGELAGKPIIMPRFPDSSIIHSHSGLEGNHTPQDGPMLHILGFHFPNLQNTINSLPEEIKSQISGYRIVYADRTYNKSVIASGLIFNSLIQDFRDKHTDPVDLRLVPNYPLNDLRKDPYISDRTNINGSFMNEVITEITSGNTMYTKTTFSFISPETSFSKTLLNKGELKIHAELYGAADCFHTFLDPYPLAKGNGGNDKAMLAGIAVGYYNNYKNVQKGNVRRKITEAMYIPANAQVATGNIGMPVNNHGREAGVLVGVNKSITDPTVMDKSRFTLNGHIEWPEKTITADEHFNCNVYKRLTRPASAYYASIKNNLPNQYGTVYDFKFIDTTYIKKNIEEFPAVFGGDCFTGLFAQKKQMSFFEDTAAYTQADNGLEGVDFKATAYIKGTRWFYRNIGGNTRVSSRMMCEDSPEWFQSGKLGYLTTVLFGVPVFWGQSSINTELRLSGDTPETTFFPYLNGGSTPLHKWLNVNAIDKENYFQHNEDYSFKNDLYVFANPDALFDPNDSKAGDYFSRAIRSEQALPEDVQDNWQIFLPLNKHDFSKSVGKLISIKGIGGRRALFRFERSLFVANMYSTLNTSAETIVLGHGLLFQQAPEELLRKDGGYAGTQSQYACDVTEYGTFLVDAHRGKIFQYGQGLRDITNQKASEWFEQYLPFRLKRQFPDIAVDNAFNPQGIGMISCFDPKSKTWWLTKKDYELVDPDQASSIRYEDGRFTLNGKSLLLSDRDVFIDRSFTIGYSVTRERFSSFASFIPDMYVSGFNNFAATKATGGSSGLWEFGKGKPGNYFGQQFPFIIEPVLKSEGLVDTIFNTIHFQSVATRKYQDMLIEVPTETFNKVIVYNGQHNSGLQDLVVEDENRLDLMHFDMNGLILRGRGSDWNFSEFYDIAKDGRLDFFTNRWTEDMKKYYPIDKVLNAEALDYNKNWFEQTPIKGTYVRVRLFYFPKDGIKLSVRAILSRQRIQYP